MKGLDALNAEIHHLDIFGHHGQNVMTTDRKDCRCQNFEPCDQEPISNIRR